VDLSPRTTTTLEAPAEHPRRKRPWPAIIVLVLVLVGGGIAITKFLTSAIDYYCNANEVGVKSGCEAGRELRIQGTVDEGTVAKSGGVTRFTISFGPVGDRVTIPVRYQGGDVDLFQECIPVVIHGKLIETNGTKLFEGTEIEVKHSSQYESEHADRVNPATGKTQSAACSQVQA
jgi:cytochrome c-type biogenesis protein CcmE